jgi:hypothetical protein
MDPLKCRARFVRESVENGPIWVLINGAIRQ